MGHWGFVGLAYGLAALILGGYWWSIERRIRERRAVRSYMMRERHPS
jgi:hypothetical protein